MYSIAKNIGLIAQNLKTVPDLETGGERYERYGAWTCLSLFPLGGSPNNAPVILAEPPAVLLTADSLQDLKKMIMDEIDQMIEVVEKFERGELNDISDLSLAEEN